MKCNVCGSDNVEGAMFCEDCGSKLAAPAPVIAASPAPVVAAVPSAVGVPAPTPAPMAPPPAPALTDRAVPSAAGAFAPAPTPVPMAPPPALAPGMVACPSCQHGNAAGAAFCEECGSKLGAAPAPVAPPPAPAPAPVAPPPAPAPAPAPVAPPPAPAPAPAPVAPPPAPAPAPAPVAPPPAPAPAPAAATVNCPNCGYPNASGSSFCEDCGASMSAAPASPVVSDAPTAPAAAPVAPPVAETAPAGLSPRLVMPKGLELPITKEHTLLGRNSPADNIYPEVDLTEEDPESYVSRRHGQITRQGSKFIYEDIGSSNGSYINGSRLQPHIQTELHDGDSLRLGRTEMTFRT